MTKRNDIVQAVADALAGALASEVLRDAERPEEVGANGLVIVVDQEPDEPEVTLSPARWHYQHTIDLELYVQAGTKAARTTALEGLIAAVRTALDADPTFGGLAGASLPAAPTYDNQAVQGAQTIASAIVPLTLDYQLNHPLE